MTSYFTGGNSTFVGMSRFKNSPKVLTANDIVAENLNVKNIGGGSDDGGGGGGGGGSSGTVNISNLNVSYTFNLIPPGTIFTFASIVIPDGYLLCDGSRLQISMYQNLYDTIGTLYNTIPAPPVGTFNIPDFRGYFIRGFDSTGIIDPGRLYGSKQDDGLKAHTHLVDAGFAGFGGSTNPQLNNNANSSVPQTSGSTGGAETRPKNIAVNICIKF